MARHQDFATVHLVFITKCWHRVFDGDAIKRLRGLFSELAQRRIEPNAPTEETCEWDAETLVEQAFCAGLKKRMRA